MTLRREKVLVCVVIQSIIAAVFLGIEAVNASRAAPAPAWLVTPLDQALPLVPGAVWFYVSWYATAAVLLPLERDDFRRASGAVLVGFLLCAVGYLALPVAMERPPMSDRAGLSAAVLRAVYAVDHPRNIFPSFHATLAGVVLTVVPGPRSIRVPLTAWMAAVCVSCVLTKQHYVLDVVAGLGAGALAVSAVDAVGRSMIHLRGEPSSGPVAGVSTAP